MSSKCCRKLHLGATDRIPSESSAASHESKISLSSASSSSNLLRRGMTAAVGGDEGGVELSSSSSCDVLGMIHRRRDSVLTPFFRHIHSFGNSDFKAKLMFLWILVESAVVREW